MDTLTVITAGSALEPELPSVPVIYGDMLEVGLQESSLDLGAHADETALSWSWSSSPEWTLS